MAKIKKLGTSKELEELARIARAQRWEVSHTDGNHIQFKPPQKDKPSVITGMTGSDYRAFQNLKSRLRRSGLRL